MTDQKTIEALLERPVGVCGFEAVTDRLLNCRNKARLPAGAQSVLLFLFPYRVKQEPPQNLCRYAAVPDYHRLVGERLQQYAERLQSAFPKATFVSFVDNSPVPEVYAAACAGLGVVGDNGMLLSERYGSFVFIGEIVTDLAVAWKNRYAECAHCGACRSACPVGLDKSRCLSGLTQKKGELTDEERRRVAQGGLVWGCDICAHACPYNRATALCEEEELVKGYRDRYVPGEDITDRAFAWRGEAVLLRNAAICAAAADAPSASVPAKTP